MTQEPRNTSPPLGGRWFWLDNGVVERIAEIGPLAFAVYAVLAKYADDHRRCFPAVPRIAELLGKSDRAVQDAMDRLEKASLIQVELSKGGRGKNATNRYRLLPLPPPCKGEASFTRTRPNRTRPT